MSSKFFHCPCCEKFFVSKSGFRFHLEDHELSETKIDIIIDGRDTLNNQLSNVDSMETSIAGNTSCSKSSPLGEDIDKCFEDFNALLPTAVLFAGGPNESTSTSFNQNDKTSKTDLEKAPERVERSNKQASLIPSNQTEQEFFSEDSQMTPVGTELKEHQNVSGDLTMTFILENLVKHHCQGSNEIVQPFYHDGLEESTDIPHMDCATEDETETAPLSPENELENVSSVDFLSAVNESSNDAVTRKSFYTGLNELQNVSSDSFIKSVAEHDPKDETPIKCESYEPQNDQSLTINAANKAMQDFSVEPRINSRPINVNDAQLVNNSNWEEKTSQEPDLATSRMNRDNNAFKMLPEDPNDALFSDNSEDEPFTKDSPRQNKQRQGHNEAMFSDASEDEDANPSATKKIKSERKHDPPMGRLTDAGLSNEKIMKVEKVDWENVDTKVTFEEPKTLECKICAKIFQSATKLIRHITKSHEFQKEVKCQICDKDLLTNEALKQHIQFMHDASRAINCDFCEKIFYRNDTLRRHVLKVHDKMVEFECKMCPERFPQYWSLRDHIKLIHDTKSKSEPWCKYCKIAFNHFSELKDHIGSFHNIKKVSFKCNICSKSFERYKNLTEHCTYTHTRPYKCNACTKSFGKLVWLTTHLKMHHEKNRPYQCPMCPKSFASSDYVAKHVKVVHNKVKSHRCKICHREFIYLNGLNRHIKKCHQETSPKKIKEEY